MKYVYISRSRWTIVGTWELKLSLYRTVKITSNLYIQIQKFTNIFLKSFILLRSFILFFRESCTYL